MLAMFIIASITGILFSEELYTNIIKQQITSNLINTTQSRANHIETLLGEYKGLTKTLATDRLPRNRSSQCTYLYSRDGLVFNSTNRYRRSLCSDY